MRNFNYFLLTLLTLEAVSRAGGLSFEEVKVDIESNATVLAQKWNFLETNLKETAEKAIRALLPTLVRTGYEVEVSEECTGAVLTWLGGLKDLKFWAINILDSTGKPSGGQMHGNLGMFGAYDQCVQTVLSRKGANDVENPEDVVFRGQYCNLILRPPLGPKPYNLFKHVPTDAFREFHPKTELMEELKNRSSYFYKVTHRIGLCVPSKCSQDDVQKVVSFIAGKVGYNANITSCEVQETEWQLDWVQITVFAVCVFLVLLTFSASVVEYFLLAYSNKDKNDNSVTLQIVQALSLKRNMAKTFAPFKIQDDTLSCLHGFRFLSIGWVVLIHTYALADPIIYRDGIFADRFTETFMSQTVSNGGISVDAFIFISGLLLSHNVITLHEKHGSKVFNVPLLLFKRVYRLLPSAMFVIGLNVILPLTNSGPLWKEEIGLLAKNSRERWWTVPLFINNFFTFEKMPVVSFWYVAVDMQCFVLGLVFLALYFKNKLWGMAYNLFLFVGSIVSVALVVYYLNLLPTVLMISIENKVLTRQFLFSHTLPHVHVCVYAVGLTMGAFLAKRQKFKLPIAVEIVGWPLILAFMYVIIYSTYIWNSGQIPTLTESVLYACLHRAAWALCLAWITLQCSMGRGGILNEFLSWRAFAILNRLSYLVFLIHVTVNTYFMGSLNGVVDTQHHMPIFFFVSVYVISFAAAYVIRIFFEAPLMELEKIGLSCLIKKKNAPMEKSPQNGHDSNGHCVLPVINNTPTNGHTSNDISKL